MGMDIKFIFLDKDYCTPTQLNILENNNIISLDKISKEYSTEITQSIEHILYETYDYNEVNSKDLCKQIYSIIEDYYKEKLQKDNGDIQFIKINRSLINRIYNCLNEDITYLQDRLSNSLNRSCFVFCYIGN